MTTKTKLKGILAGIAALGFKLDVDNLSGTSDWNEVKLFPVKKVKDRWGDWVNAAPVVTISFDASQCLPHCCGIREVGEFSLDYTKNSKSLTAAEKSATELAIQYVFLKVHEDNAGTGTGSKRRSQLVMFNSNGEYPEVEKAFKGIDAWYSLATQFINRNSGNTIKVYHTI